MNKKKLKDKKVGGKIIIRPQDFVSKPFISCPKCKKDNQFGVLMINRNSYVRRCNNCMYSESYELPSLEKKVVYLDQMAISNMMKAINSSSSVRGDLGKWKLLFEKLDRLVKLQLIVCPYSPIHEEESVVTTVYKDLRQMYQHLSNGVYFYSSDVVIRFQLYIAFMKWLRKDVEDITVGDIVHGDINEWQNRIRVSVNLKKDENKGYVKDVERHRDILSWGFVHLFKYWKKEKGERFKTWFQREINSFGEAYWEAYCRLALSDDATELMNYTTSQQSILIAKLTNILRKEGLDHEKEIFIKLENFFRSEQVKEIPYVQLFSMLDAALANQTANGGRTQPPNQGTHNDLTMIATYTPYCDALFIDNAFREAIKQGEKHLGLDIYNKFYSQSNFKEFLDYLDKIESEAPKDHILKVKEVYGEEWINAFVTMYNKK